MNLLNEVSGFLGAHLGVRARMGVAVSGGVDSVALLDLVAACRREEPDDITILHLDHGLRQDSGEDRKFVESLSRRYGFRCVSAVVEEPIEGPSIENSARIARYRFFRRCAEEFNLAAVLTAHTADDQAETVLFRLLRGTGRPGLAGIRPARRIDGMLVLRPLLGFAKKELEQYAENRGLSFRKDASNDAVRYRRNRLRHQILPFLREHLNPQVDHALCRLAGIMQAEEEWIETIVAREMPIWTERDGCFGADLARLRELPTALQARLIMGVLERLGASVDYELVERIGRLSECGGRFDLRDDLAAWRDDVNERLCIGMESRSEEERLSEYTIAAEGATEIPDLGLRFVLSRQPGGPDLGRLRFHSETANLDHLRETAFFAADSIRGPIRVRTRRPGDRISPFGMKGRKKLHDLFIDEKIGLHQRDRWPILCDDEGVLWVIGVKQDERTRVTAATETILRVDVVSSGSDPGPERIA